MGNRTVAIYRLEAKIIGRSMGKSAVAAAAYRSGRSIVSIAAYRSAEKLKDYSRDITFDYSRKERVEYSAILAPADSPAWVYDREKLWNAVEAREDRAKRPHEAQLAREVLVTLPRELDAEQCIELVHAFIEDQFVSRGMIADVSIHRPDASDGGEQPHAHILLTMRRLEDGEFTSKARDWNWKINEWRPAWQEHANQALKEAGHAARIDHRSLKDRSIDRKPQPKQGVAMHARTHAPHLAARRMEYARVNYENRVRSQARALARLRAGKRLPPGIHATVKPQPEVRRAVSQDAEFERRRRRRAQAVGPGEGIDR